MKGLADISLSLVTTCRGERDAGATVPVVMASISDLAELFSISGPAVYRTHDDTSHAHEVA